MGVAFYFISHCHPRLLALLLLQPSVPSFLFLVGPLFTLTFPVSLCRNKADLPAQCHSFQPCAI